MSYRAIDDLPDAVDAVRAFMWPFEMSRWWRLALMAFFVSGAGVGSVNVPGQLPGASIDGTGPTGTPGEGAVPTGLDGDLLLVVLAVVAVAALLGLAFAVLGSVMELALLDSLAAGRVEVRRFVRRRFRQGIRLLLFRIGLGLAGLVAGAVLVGVVAAPALALDAPGVSLVLALVAIPVFLVLGLALALANGFTTAFVAPAMVQEDLTPVPAWRRVWPVLRGNLDEMAVYVVVAFVLSVVRGIVVGIASLLAAVALLIPFGVLGIGAFALLQVAATAGLVLLVVVGALFLLALLVAVAFVRAPVVVFFRYYWLLLLGDLAPDLDLIPDVRERIRAEPGAGTPPAA